jgi:hypothetical protein
MGPRPSKQRSVTDGSTEGARYDDHYMLMRFTPRRMRSKWSQINRERAEQLIAQGNDRQDLCR